MDRPIGKLKIDVDSPEFIQLLKTAQIQIKQLKKTIKQIDEYKLDIKSDCENIQ